MKSDAVSECLWAMLKPLHTFALWHHHRDESNKGYGDREVPTWCPPPLTFPIVWGAITILRSAAGLLVWRETGALLCAPILAFTVHKVRAYVLELLRAPAMQRCLTITELGCRRQVHAAHH